MVGLFQPYEPQPLTFLRLHGQRTSQSSRTVSLCHWRSLDLLLCRHERASSFGKLLRSAECRVLGRNGRLVGCCSQVEHATRIARAIAARGSARPIQATMSTPPSPSSPDTKAISVAAARQIGMTKVPPGRFTRASFDGLAKGRHRYRVRRSRQRRGAPTAASSAAHRSRRSAAAARGGARACTTASGSSR